jgi:hypothetical protein
MDIVFLFMQLAGHCISVHATAWILLGHKSHRSMCNFS